MAVLLAILVGVQIPGFVDEYGKNLSARLAESTKSVTEFQGIADKYFKGSLDALLDHFESKPDPVIVAGGESISTIVSRNQSLLKAQTAFNKKPYESVFLKPIQEIRKDTWLNYTYKVVLNKAAIISAVACGVIILILLDMIFFVLGALFSLPFRKKEPPRTRSRVIN